MTTVKKLFFMTVLGLAAVAQISASENQSDDRGYLSFIGKLRQVKSANAMNDANWMSQKYVATDDYSTNITSQLKNIVESNQPLPAKISAIEEIKARETAPKVNESYFSSMSNMAKAAVALVVTASIASYFYFIRPWTKASVE